MNEKTQDFDILIANAQKKLIANLEAVTRDLSVAELPSVSRSLDIIIQEQLQSVTIDLCFKDTSPHDVVISLPYIDIGDRSYEIRIQENLLDSYVLGMAVLPRGLYLNVDKQQPHRIKMPGYGKYQEAHIYLPPEFQSLIDILKDATNKLFLTAYSWFDEYLARVINDVEIDTTRELYRYLKAIFYNENITKNLWLSAGTKGCGHYILNPNVVQSTLELITPIAPQVGESPARIIAEFLNAAVPVEKTHGLAAVKAGKCIDVDLSKSMYKTDMNLLNKAQMIVFGSMTLSMFPIYKDNSTYLIAVFPKDKKDIIEPVLQKHKSELASIFKLSKNRLARLYRFIVMKEGNFDISQLGKLMGGIISGMMN